jgi:hypothetical protein
VGHRFPVDVDKLTVEKFKGKLKDIGAWNETTKGNQRIILKVNSEKR